MVEGAGIADELVVSCESRKLAAFFWKKKRELGREGGGGGVPLLRSYNYTIHPTSHSKV